MEPKKLMRSNNKMICGVCAGVADYINVDPTIVRLAWVLFGFAGGSGVLAYIIAAIIMPVQS
jgi:phage shock protein PspC (stress-responsive transcriptional regulator)